MPIILEETEVSLDRLDLHRRYPVKRPVTKRGLLAEASRTPGIHLSGILRYLALEGGMMKKYGDDGLDEDQLPLRMALGLAWEEFAVSLYPDIHWQPGELTYQGIVMTCDGLSHLLQIPQSAGPAWPPPEAQRPVIEPSTCLEEFKLTWKKRRTAEELLRDEWYWMQQGRGYCWGYEARLVRWHICYVMGDYRGGGPIYMRYLVLFSDQDIAKSAKMLLVNRDRAAEKGYCE